MAREDEIYREIDKAMVRIRVALAKKILFDHDIEALNPARRLDIEDDLSTAIDHLEAAQKDRIPF